MLISYLKQYMCRIFKESVFTMSHFMQIFLIHFLPSLIFCTLLAFFFYIDTGHRYGHRATADCEMYYSTLIYNDRMFNQDVKKTDVRLNSLLIHQRTSGKVCTVQLDICKPN